MGGVEEVLDGGDWSASGPGCFTTEEWAARWHQSLSARPCKEKILCHSGIELQYFGHTVRSFVTALTELTRFLLQCASTLLGVSIPLAPFAACVFFYLLSLTLKRQSGLRKQRCF
jgi:hypothetical protein